MAGATVEHVGAPVGAEQAVVTWPADGLSRPRPPVTTSSPLPASSGIGLTAPDDPVVPASGADRVLPGAAGDPVVTIGSVVSKNTRDPSSDEYTATAGTAAFPAVALVVTSSSTLWSAYAVGAVTIMGTATNAATSTPRRTPVARETIAFPFGP